MTRSRKPPWQQWQPRRFGDSSLFDYAWLQIVKTAHFHTIVGSSPEEPAALMASLVDLLGKALSFGELGSLHAGLVTIL